MLNVVDDQHPRRHFHTDAALDLFARFLDARRLGNNAVGASSIYLFIVANGSNVNADVTFNPGGSCTPFSQNVVLASSGQVASDPDRAGPAAKIRA